MCFRRFSQKCEKRLFALSCLSVCPPPWNTSAHTAQISWHFIAFFFSKICRENSGFKRNLTRITGTSHEGVCTYKMVSHWLLLRMRNVSDKSSRENQNIHFIFCNSIFFFFGNRAVYEIMWEKKTVLSLAHYKRQYKTVHAHCMLDT